MSIDKELLQELQQAFGRSDASQDPLMRELLKERLVSTIQARIDTLQSEKRRIMEAGSLATRPAYHTRSTAELQKDVKLLREMAVECRADAKIVREAGMSEGRPSENQYRCCILWRTVRGYERDLFQDSSNPYEARKIVGNRRTDEVERLKRSADEAELIASEIERRIPEMRRIEQDIDEAQEKIRQMLKL
jgi:hypothetical protein